MSEFEHPMDAESFRRFGYKVIDLIADYHEQVATPILPSRPFGELLKKLSDEAPFDPESFDAVLKDVQNDILPSLTHWLSPRFFAYFPCNGSFPAILGELLSAGLSQQGMIWLTSPACTELEMKTLDWLAKALGLPTQFQHESKTGGGVIQGSASEAILVALVAARDAKRKLHPNAHSEEFVFYGSKETHSSLLKACKIAGVNNSQIRLIQTKNGMMDEASFEAVLFEDKKRGRIPTFVCATVGTTGNGAIDPLKDIGKLAKMNNLWLHIDAAWAGSACICPEYRSILDGVEHADSFCFNPHKWLLVSFDCSALFVKDKSALMLAMSVTPEYLRNRASNSGQVTDFRDWQIPLGRRMRALKLWFVLRTYGLNNLRRFIHHGVELAAHFEKWLSSKPLLEMSFSRSLSLVCFAVKDSREKTEKLLQGLNESGQVFLSHSVVEEKYVIRVSFGGQYTRVRDVDLLCQLIETKLKSLS